MMNWLLCVYVSQSCPTPCNPMDCSLQGSSVHGIPQARILEWVVIPFSRRSSRPRDWTWVSCIGGRFFTIWDTREALIMQLLFPGNILCFQIYSVWWVQKSCYFCGLHMAYHWYFMGRSDTLFRLLNHFEGQSPIDNFETFKGISLLEFF